MLRRSCSEFSTLHHQPSPPSPTIMCLATRMMSKPAPVDGAAQPGSRRFSVLRTPSGLGPYLVVA